jgi:hypothetical protein
MSPRLTTHAAWMEAAAALLAPLTELMEPGRADIPIHGPESNHGLPADRVESFARPCLLAAQWLRGSAYHPGARAGRMDAAELAAWFRQGLLRGVNPADPQYWGPSANYHQHTVEMGALVLAFEMARDWLWEPFQPAERRLIADWLGTVRGVALHRNNHMFFGLFPLEFLGREGHGLPGDEAFGDFLLNTLESMHLGGGWFVDGMNESVDYYNAYAFHYYGLWWARLNAKRHPLRADRWMNWAGQFLRDYTHFFAASGENPPFGRSISYRFAATAPFALAQSLGIGGVSPGLARRVCRLNLEFFLRQRYQQDQGALSLGWTDELPAIAEAYSCAASPYWAAKAFAPLLLAPDHPFWTAPEEPLPAERGDFARPIRSVGLVARGVGGAVELLNAQSMISQGNMKYGVWKWGRLSYRTGAGYLVPSRAEDASPDCALTARSADGTVWGRHATYPLAVEPDHIASVYALGNRFSQFNAQLRSYLWWRGPWQLHLHFHDAQQPTVLTLGSYSLAAESPPGLVQEGATWHNGALRVALEPIHGLAAPESLLEETPRRHLLAPASVTLTTRTPEVQGPGFLAALSYAGEATLPYLPWAPLTLAAGQWTFTRAGGETWAIEHPILPACSR